MANAARSVARAHDTAGLRDRTGIHSNQGAGTVKGSAV